MARRIPPPIPLEKEQLLAGTPELAKLRADRTSQLDDAWPEPDLAMLQDMYADWRTEFTQWHALARHNREVRFQQDKLPAKMQKALKFGRRFHSRLGHNEILRTVSLQTRNDYKVQVLARGSGAKQTQESRDRAVKQTRWLQQLRAAMERRANRPLRRQVVDGQHGDALGAWEIYLTDAYEDPRIKRREGETDKEYLDRTDDLLQTVGPPFGLRPVDMTALFYDEDDDGLACAMIVERRPRKAELRRLRMLGKISRDREQQMREMAPMPSERGAQPVDDSRPGSDPVIDEVECWRYYDHRWYAYVVDGEFIEGPTEHGLPGCPIIPVYGIPTGSPNRHEMWQGVTWGMVGLELVIDYLMTKEVDNAYRFGEPKVAVKTERGYGHGIPASQPDGPPPTLDFDDGVPYLAEGQDLIDATAAFKQHDTGPTQERALSFFQRSGLNQIASGASPGASPAGYTVNSLMGAAQDQYEVLFDNEARAWERVCDFVRLMIRDTIRETVYLSVPMADGKPGGTEWLALSPSDIDETPCEVTIDPLSDANRQAVRDSLIKGNQLGYISMERVMREGFGIEDVIAEMDKMIVERTEKQLADQAVQEALAIVRGAMQQPAPGSGFVDQHGNPLQPTGGPGQPAATNPPTVGAQAAQASQGGAGHGGTPAGQSNGYTPPGAAEPALAR